MKGYSLSYFFGTSGGFQCFLVAEDAGEVSEMFGTDGTVPLTQDMSWAVWSALGLNKEERRLAAVHYQADGRWFVQLAGPAAQTLWGRAPSSGASGENAAQWLADAVRTHLLRRMPA